MDKEKLISCRIRKDQYDYLKSLNETKSRFIRKAIDEKIQRPKNILTDIKEVIREDVKKVIRDELGNRTIKTKNNSMPGDINSNLKNSIKEFSKQLNNH